MIAATRCPFILPPSRADARGEKTPLPALARHALPVEWLGFFPSADRPSQPRRGSKKNKGLAHLFNFRHVVRRVENGRSFLPLSRPEELSHLVGYLWIKRSGRLV